MLKSSLVKLVIAVAALVLPAVVSSADAAVVEVAYQIRRPGSSGTFQPMRYTDPEGNVTLLAGYSIVSTHITLNYVPSDAEQLAAFDYGLAVPVTGAVSSYISLLTADLTAVGDGSYTYELTTSDHNGEITSGTFGYQLFGRGTYTDSFVTYTVSIPEPASAAATLAPAALLVLRRRR